VAKYLDRKKMLEWIEKTSNKMIKELAERTKKLECLPTAFPIFFMQALGIARAFSLLEKAIKEGKFDAKVLKKQKRGGLSGR